MLKVNWNKKVHKPFENKFWDFQISGTHWTCYNGHTCGQNSRHLNFLCNEGFIGASCQIGNKTSVDWNWKSALVLVWIEDINTSRTTSESDHFFQRSSHVKTGITRTQTSRLLLFFIKVFFIQVGFKRHQRFSTRQGCETVFYVNSEKPARFDTLRECSSVRLMQVSLQLLTKKCLLCLGQTKHRWLQLPLTQSQHPCSVTWEILDVGMEDGHRSWRWTATR